MSTDLPAATRRRLAHPERGAATLESVGMYTVAAVLAVAVLFAATVSFPVVGEKFRQAVCLVTTLGQGSCESSVGASADNKPTEPCVVSAQGHTGALEASFVVTVGAGEQFLVEKLNNGKSRVTRGINGKVGVGVGVGANLSATWDDKTYGGAASADASIAATFSGGEVYYADNEAEVSDIMSAHKEAVSKMAVASSGGLGSLAVGAVNLAEGVLNVGHDFPPVDETYVEGGVSAEAKAEATFLMANAQAGRGIQSVLGTRQGADGTSTTYYQASLDGNISAGTWAADEQTNQNIYAKAGLEGRAEGVVEIERDAKGIITAVRVKSVLSGTAEAGEVGGTVNDGPGTKQGYIENVVNLPTHSATDQAIAQRYLNALGMGPAGGFNDLPEDAQSYVPIPNPFDALGATKAFGQAASNHGLVTKQAFDDQKSSSYAAAVALKALGKFSGGATVETVSRRSTGAEYWDGSSGWAPWTGCGGK